MEIVTGRNSLLASIVRSDDRLFIPAILNTEQRAQTAAFDALAPTTTQGDVIYFNGTDNVRLGIGTAGQALVVNTGATAPEWGTAGITTGKSIAMAMIFGF